MCPIAEATNVELILQSLKKGWYENTFLYFIFIFSANQIKKKTQIIKNMSETEFDSVDKVSPYDTTHKIE